jgi:hypothetical protein
MLFLNRALHLKNIPGTQTILLNVSLQIAKLIKEVMKKNSAKGTQ